MTAQPHDPRNMTKILLLVFAEIDRYKYSQRRKFRRRLNTLRADPDGEQTQARAPAQERPSLQERQPEEPKP